MKGRKITAAIVATLATGCFVIGAGACDLGQELSPLIGGEDSSVGAIEALYEQAKLGGYTGDLESFTESIRGLGGVAGKDGADGKDGQNGKDGVDGKDGEDGEDLTVEALYAAAVAEGYEGELLDFILELGVEYNANNDTLTIAENVSSVVSIYCGFKTGATVNASGGSGVVWEIDKESGTAYIVTNYHVIYDSESDTGISEEIFLYPYGGYIGFTSATGTDETGHGIKAAFVGGAMEYDIALLKVENSEKIKKSALTAVEPGDSDAVKVGEKTFAIGNANGLGVAVTSGVVSVDSETISLTAFDGSNEPWSFRVMRTDAAVNHGNSGGGLFDLNGKLIGITNAKNVEDETDNICYALPIALVRRAVENIRDNGGCLMRAIVGITTTLDDAAMYLDDNGELAVRESFSVTKIEAGRAADGTFKIGDRIQSITLGGETYAITRRYVLNDLLLSVRMGDVVAITVLRKNALGKEEEVVITLDYNNAAYFAKYE